MDQSPNKRISTVANQLDKANLLVGSHRFSEARKLLESLRPTLSLETSTEETAFFYYLNGFIAWKLGEKKLALTAAQKARQMYLSLRNFDGIAKAENLVGALLIDLGNLKQAGEHLELAVAGFKYANDWKSAARSLNRLASVHIIRGELKRALEYIEQARESASQAGEHYYEIVQQGLESVCLWLSGRWKLAKVNLKEFLIETKRANDNANYVLGLVNFGHSEFVGNYLKEARKHYLDAVKVCTEESLIGTLKIAYEHLAELSIAEGCFSEAEDYLKKALEIGERVSPYGTIMTQCWRLMGDLHLAKKEYDQALKAYETCRSYLIKLPEKLEEGAMYRGMGICYLHKDQLTTAQSCFRKAIEIFEACENDWELAKTYVEAAEWGVFALAELRPKLTWARGIFKELEHPAWETRVQLLLGRSEPLSSELPLRLAHEVADRERILQVLDGTEGNVSRAADKLGITRQALHYKIKRYKIDL